MAVGQIGIRMVNLKIFTLNAVEPDRVPEDLATVHHLK